MEDCLGIGARAVAMTLLLELCLQLGMVVDFAVVDDPGAVGFVRHRLRASGDIDDRQPSVGQPCRALDPHALSVGTAVTQDVPHSAKSLSLHSVRGLALDDSGNSAHR